MRWAHDGVLDDTRWTDAIEMAVQAADNRGLLEADSDADDVARALEGAGFIRGHNGLFVGCTAALPKTARLALWAGDPQELPDGWNVCSGQVWLPAACASPWLPRSLRGLLRRLCRPLIDDRILLIERKSS